LSLGLEHALEDQMRIEVFFRIFTCLISISLLTPQAFAQEKEDSKIFCSVDFIKDYNQLVHSRKNLASASQQQRNQKATFLNNDCKKFYESYGTSIKCQANVGDEITEISSDEHLLMCELVKAAISS
jgi:hypothetical protein